MIKLPGPTGGVIPGKVSYKFRIEHIILRKKRCARANKMMFFLWCLCNWGLEEGDGGSNPTLSSYRLYLI